MDLAPYLSDHLPSQSSLENANDNLNFNSIPPIYDLVGISNHMGGLGGGHYVAHADTHSDLPGRDSRWMCFNDDRVSTASPTDIAGPTAYVLFYRLRNDSMFVDAMISTRIIRAVSQRSISQEQNEEALESGKSNLVAVRGPGDRSRLKRDATPGGL